MATPATASILAGPRRRQDFRWGNRCRPCRRNHQGAASFPRPLPALPRCILGPVVRKVALVSGLSGAELWACDTSYHVTRTKWQLLRGEASHLQNCNGFVGSRRYLKRLLPIPLPVFRFAGLPLVSPRNSSFPHFPFRNAGWTLNASRPKLIPPLGSRSYFFLPQGPFASLTP